MTSLLLSSLDNKFYAVVMPEKPEQRIEGNELSPFPSPEGRVILEEYKDDLKQALASKVLCADQFQASEIFYRFNMFHSVSPCDVPYVIPGLTFTVGYITDEGIHVKTKRYFKHGESIENMKEATPVALLSLSPDTGEKQEPYYEQFVNPELEKRVDQILANKKSGSVLEGDKKEDAVSLIEEYQGMYDETSIQFRAAEEIIIWLKSRASLERPQE